MISLLVANVYIIRLFVTSVYIICLFVARVYVICLLLVCILSVFLLLCVNCLSVTGKMRFHSVCSHKCLLKTFVSVLFKLEHILISFLTV